MGELSSTQSLQRQIGLRCLLPPQALQRNQHLRCQIVILGVYFQYLSKSALQAPCLGRLPRKRGAPKVRTVENKVRHSVGFLSTAIAETCRHPAQQFLRNLRSLRSPDFVTARLCAPPAPLKLSIG